MVPLDMLRQKGTPPVNGSNLESRRVTMLWTLIALRSGAELTTGPDELAKTGLMNSRGISTADVTNAVRILPFSPKFN